MLWGGVGCSRMTNAVVISGSGLVPAATSRDVLDRLADFLRLNVNDGDASERTVQSYLTHVGQFTRWCWAEDIDPSQATPKDLAHFRRYLVDRRYTRSTINVKLSAVRRFYQAVTWYGLRQDNPAEGLRPPRDHTTRRDRLLERYLSPEEIDSLMELPNTDTPVGKRDLAMLAVLYYHALRVSEVAGLSLHDLKAGDPTTLHVVESKGHKSRVLVMTVKSLAFLKPWLAVRSQFIRDDDEPMFLSAKGGRRLTPQGVRWIVRQYLRAAGLYRDGMGPHAIRHAHASHAVANGADINALAAELGHASVQTTTVYVHVVDAVKQNPAEFL